MVDAENNEDARYRNQGQWFALSGALAWGGWSAVCAGALLLLHVQMGWPIPARDGSFREGLTIIASIAYLLIGVFMHHTLYSHGPLRNRLFRHDIPASGGGDPDLPEE